MSARFFSNPPLSVYVHLPWCEHKCPYCDFNSHQSDHIDESAYIQALNDDLMQDLPLVWGRSITSLFIGGGTPSLFSGDAIHQLLSNLRAGLNFHPHIEITLEANPGSADAARFKDYFDAGVNRLSIGIQSFNDAHLNNLQRVHNRQQAFRAYEKARQAGFDNINLDLMYALPGQTLNEAVSDVLTAIDLQPEHISHYQLTIEPNTHFHAHRPRNLPDDEISWQMQVDCQALMSEYGYGHYEISAYARPDYRSQHNLNYWLFGDYLGLGAGAHGKITQVEKQQVLRQVRTRQPKAYLISSPDNRLSQSTVLNDQDLAFEFMLNALRLVDGFDRALFTERSGLNPRILSPALERAFKLGLLLDSGGTIKPTELGLQFHNNLQSLFLDLDTPTVHSTEPEIQF